MDTNCKKDNNRRYLWHLSCSPRLGADIVTMVPSRRGVNRGSQEPKNTRFCCSIHPAGGFVALPLNDRRRYYLYRSVRKVTSYKPYEVGDAPGTGERWLFDECDFKKVAVISPDDFCAYYDKVKKYAILLGSAGRNSIRNQRNAAKAILRKLDREYFICR